MKSPKPVHSFLPLSGREFPRYSAIKTFFRLPLAADHEEFDVALLGIPFDGGVSYRPGARFAPAKVREMSSLGRGFHMESKNSVFERVRVADVGDCSTIPLSIEATYEKIEERVLSLLKSGKKVFSCGGDHSITLPILRAFRKHYKTPLNLIHLDAHLDTYPAAWDCEYHHGAFLRHAINEKLVDPRRCVQFGIRGPLAAESDLDFPRSHGIRIFTMDDIRNGDLPSFLSKIPKFSDGPTYITTDVDCMDPAFAPGTGTPVPGGLTSYEVQRILRALQIKNLVGGDVVEISPPYDHGDITSIVGVDILFQYLAKVRTDFWD